MHDNATSAFWRMQVDSKEPELDIVAWMNQNLTDVGYAGMSDVEVRWRTGDEGFERDIGVEQTMRYFYNAFSGAGV